MRLTKLISLTEAIPSESIFQSMSGLSFIPDSTVASYLDAEYFLNRSGTKQASPLVERWIDREFPAGKTLEGELAALITNRYSFKWNQLFRQYSSLGTLDLLKNISLVNQTNYGKSVVTTGSDTLVKSGSETETTKMDETKTESYDSLNPRKSSRSISGKYTDATNEIATRSGTEEILESFPTDRKSTKRTTGGYSDTDTITNTRSGSQLVTDKGSTETSVYGFNSSSPVPSQIVGPEDSTLGTTSETTFGQEGLKDAHSGSITRSYNPETGLVEETSESGQRKTATTYGQDGLKDSLNSGTTRTYDNYKDEVIESGQKTLSTSYGIDGKTVELSFDNRRDSRNTSESVANSGSDSETQSGYKYDSLVDEYLTLFAGAEYLDFLDIVFNDVDEILTCPFYV